MESVSITKEGISNNSRLQQPQQNPKHPMQKHRADKHRKRRKRDKECQRTTQKHKTQRTTHKPTRPMGNRCRLRMAICHGNNRRLLAVLSYASIIDGQIDGNWSGWRVTSSCSVTCGSGLQYMERSCNNPAPSNGGINCTGSAFKHQACVRKACAVPVNGGWSSWRVARTCSKTCGPGTVLLERSCDNPVPKHGGSYCSGQGFSQRTCNLGACPVDGQWSKWGAWDSCSASCNGGYMSRVRSCDNPVPSGGGNQCTGVRRDTNKCNTNDCPCGSYFIGANDKARERQFEWTNSGRSLYSTYSNWCPFQPDDDGPVGEDCVILWARCGYKWNDDESFPEEKLIGYLFKDYYKYARPAQTPDTMTNVTFNLSVISLDDFDSKRGVLTSRVWISMSWEDHRLAWHGYADMFDRVKLLHVPPSDIWTPDIVLVNSLEPFVPQFPPRLDALVQDDGRVLLVVPSVLNTRCDATNSSSVWKCTYRCMSWTYNGNELRPSLGYNGLLLSDYSSAPWIEIDASKAIVKERLYACCPEPFYEILFTIYIKMTV
ncbi:hypothetical protein FSP39_005764 [Pinctada imbricata]|uniref:C-type lectin domain-containing protein n=1 Tax=Pinctada imbricata TaxID=66713 RepID=A0AA89C5I4_PINIB|nr:hypothetical protein FSP39_005764 [Pinctada imbricata]